MRLPNEKEIVERILAMQGVGNASEHDSLPVLFKEVYGIELKKCSDCRTKAFNALMKWAQNKSKPLNNISMAYKIKPQFVHEKFVFRHNGALVVVTADNLTDERARWMLANPKYKHAIIGQEELFNNPETLQTTSPVVAVLNPGKQEEAKTDPPKDESPNVSEAVTASTSTEVKADGSKQVFAVKGKLSKSPVSQQSTEAKGQKSKSGRKPADKAT